MVFLMPLSAGQTTLSAWHARSGRTAWSRTVPAGAAAVAAGSVLYLASGRTLTALVPATGSVRWTYQLGAAVVDMTASSNAVYALDAHGGVSALRV
jgi:outer membrane protein assembly factor BamB